VAGTIYSFGPFELDAAARRLTRAGTLVPLPDRHCSVLLDLVAHAGSVRSKDALVETAWQGVAVTDNSLEQAVSALRRILGSSADGQPYIVTVPRQGYRFAGEVARATARATDASLDALLAPHRAFVEGRAALETLERDAIIRARRVFEDVLRSVPDQASAHVGLANACVMQFEMTRADASPDVAALQAAARHAREACRLDPQYGEAWATLGFVLDRAGQHGDAVAVSRRAIAIEPDNWRHQLRLASVSWGEERLRASHRTLALLPGFPMAHWLAATVHVARHAFDDAERELEAGIGRAEESAWKGRFSSVALHWLQGVIHLARGRDAEAMRAFERELALESSGHLYARECCANTWYAVGVLRLRQARLADAREAFASALARVPAHALARIAMEAVCTSAGGAPFTTTAAIGDTPDGTVVAASGRRLAPATGPRDVPAPPGATSVDAAFVEASRLVLAGFHPDAARLVEVAIAAAPDGSSAGWTLPVEPLLDAGRRPDVWATALARLRTRSA
jgi:DNA-binding winged helix-turn-helix (wHTH) protein/Tfp pilus assembly protein PilF